MMINRREVMAGILGTVCCPTLSAAAAATDDQFHVICGMGGTPRIKGIKNMRPAAPEAIRTIRWISNAIGVRPSFEILAADFTHGGIAVAATRGNQRYVVYDAKWFRFSENKVGWYEVFILAHEIGHHIHGHTHGFNPSRHVGELDSDRFGGWIVARLGGTLKQALSFMPYLNEKDSRSHPGRHKRIEAAMAGWLSGQQAR